LAKVWEAMEKALESERALLVRQAHHCFSEGCARNPGRMIQAVPESALLVEISEALVGLDDGDSFLAAVTHARPSDSR